MKSVWRGSREGPIEHMYIHVCCGLITDPASFKTNHFKDGWATAIITACNYLDQFATSILNCVQSFLQCLAPKQHPLRVEEATGLLAYTCTHMYECRCMHVNAPTYPVPDRFKTVQPVLKWSEHFKNGPSFKLVLNIYMYMSRPFPAKI